MTNDDKSTRRAMLAEEILTAVEKNKEITFLETYTELVKKINNQHMWTYAEFEENTGRSYDIIKKISSPRNKQKRPSFISTVSIALGVCQNGKDAIRLMESAHYYRNEQNDVYFEILEQVCNNQDLFDTPYDKFIFVNSMLAQTGDKHILGRLVIEGK